MQTPQRPVINAYADCFAPARKTRPVRADTGRRQGTIDLGFDNPHEAISAVRELGNAHRTIAELLAENAQLQEELDATRMQLFEAMGGRSESEKEDEEELYYDEEVAGYLPSPTREEDADDFMRATARAVFASLKEPEPRSPLSRIGSAGSFTATAPRLSAAAPSTCWGCQSHQPNQMAHMDSGGCLEGGEALSGLCPRPCAPS